MSTGAAESWIESESLATNAFRDDAVTAGGLASRSGGVPPMFAASAAALGGRVAAADALAQIVGTHPAMGHLRGALAHAACRRLPVLIEGEPGTGRTLCARVLHALGGAPDSPFVAVQGRELSILRLRALLRSWERNGASPRRRMSRGLSALGHGGTLVVEEVESLSPVAQARLLELVTGHDARNCGEASEAVNPLWVIATTTVDLDERVRRQSFRGDLLAYLRGSSLRLPPLRERGGDASLLTRHFARALRRNWRFAVWDISPSAVRRLAAHAWPGNVAGLRGAVEDALRRAGGGQILPCHVEIPGVAPERTRGASDRNQPQPVPGVFFAGGDRDGYAESEFR